MSALALTLVVLLGAPVVGLALSSSTSWLVVPGHLLFSVIAVVAALVSMLEGRPWRARAAGALHLALSLATAAALGWGAEVRGETLSWAVPWVAMLAWGWAPPVVAAAAAWVGAARARSVRRGVVRRRRAALLLERRP